MRTPGIISRPASTRVRGTTPRHGRGAEKDRGMELLQAFRPRGDRTALKGLLKKKIQRLGAASPSRRTFLFPMVLEGEAVLSRRTEF